MSDREDILAVVEKVASEQKEVTDALLERLNSITEKLIQIVKVHGLMDDLRLFDFENYGFRFMGSTHGEWIHFCYIKEYCDLHASWAKILPRKSGDISQTFYYQGDFHCPTEYMSRSELLNFCKILPDFVRNMMDKIEDLTYKEREFLERLSRV